MKKPAALRLVDTRPPRPAAMVGGAQGWDWQFGCGGCQRIRTGSPARSTRGQDELAPQEVETCLHSLVVASSTGSRCTES